MTNKKNEKDLNQIDDKTLKSIDLVVKKQDFSCPFSKWMGYDLLICSDGDIYCMKQQYYDGDQYGFGVSNYEFCNCEDHKQCEIYNKYKKE